MTRDLRLLTGAVFLSAAGDLLCLVVLALQVHALTGSGLAVSALFATTLVPVVVLAPLAGLVADRFESVRVLVAASLVQALAAAGLAFTGDLAAILALSSLLAAGNAFAQPAEFALVPAVAGEGSLARATGAVESARYAGFAAGPLLAAGLAALGPRPALLADAASFVAIAAAASAMRARRPPPAGAGRTRQRALDGARLLGHDPVLRVAIGAAAGALLFISASLTIEVFYLKDVVGAGDVAYALLVCAWMAGMVLGATALAPRVPVALAAGGALVALAVQGAGMAVQTAWAILPLAFAGYLVGGIGHGVKNVLLRVVLTVRVPEAAHGRAFAAYNAARNGAELGAVAAGGLLVGALGPRAALLLAGLGPVVAAGAGLAALRRRSAGRAIRRAAGAGTAFPGMPGARPGPERGHTADRGPGRCRPGRGETDMNPSVIHRRSAWATPEELQAAAARSATEGDRAGSGVRRIRGCVVEEDGGGLGTACRYSAESPGTIRAHATASDMPAQG